VLFGALRAADARKAPRQAAAVEVRHDALLDDRTQCPVPLLEALFVDLRVLVEVRIERAVDGRALGVARSVDALGRVDDSGGSHRDGRLGHALRPADGAGRRPAGLDRVGACGRRAEEGHGGRGVQTPLSPSSSTRRRPRRSRPSRPRDTAHVRRGDGRAAGSGLLTLISASVSTTSGGAWLKAALVGAGDATRNVAAVRVSVVRGALGDGDYTGTVTVTSDGGTERIGVTLSIGTAGGGGGTGPGEVDVYVLAIDGERVLLLRPAVLSLRGSPSAETPCDGIGRARASHEPSREHAARDMTGA